MFTAVNSMFFNDSNNVWYMILRKEFACASVLTHFSLDQDNLDYAVNEAKHENDSFLLCDAKDIDIFNRTFRSFLSDNPIKAQAQVKLGRYARKRFLYPDHDTVFVIKHLRDEIVPMIILVVKYSNDDKYMLVDAIWYSIWGSLNKRYGRNAFSLIENVLSETKRGQRVERVYHALNTEGTQKMLRTRGVRVIVDEDQNAPTRYYYEANLVRPKPPVMMPTKKTRKRTKKRTKIKHCIICNKIAEYACECASPKDVYCSEVCQRIDFSRHKLECLKIKE